MAATFWVNAWCVLPLVTFTNVKNQAYLFYFSRKKEKQTDSKKTQRKKDKQKKKRTKKTENKKNKQKTMKTF